MEVSSVTIKATTYTVSLLPEDSIDAPTYEITVEHRGHDRWAVMRRRQCLGTDGTWDYEPHPSERTEAWLSAHRFTCGEALDLAMKAAPGVKVNGMTAAEVLAQLEARDITAEEAR